MTNWPTVPADMHIKKPALLRWLAWFLAALSLALVVAGFVVSWRLGQRWLSTHMVFAPVTTITYALIGTLVAARQPRNPIGWIFGAVGVFAGLTWLSSSYKMVGQSMLPGFEVAQWLNLWIWIPTSILPLTFVLLLFPNGRLPSPRWWPIAWSAGLGLAAFIVSTALHPRPPIEPIAPANPFGIPSAVGVLNLLANSTYILLPVGAFGSLAALVVRFRRSRGIEREQIKWLAYGSTIAILCIWVMSAWWAARPFDRVAYELTLGSVWVALTIIVIAAGIAILRHGLYNIDILINRTLVYGALSAGVVGLYVLLVGALGALFQSSGNLVIALLATGVAALLAQPLRAHLQRGVNRLMYGERDDPYTVLSHLSQQLKTTLAPTAVLPNIAQAVAQTLKLPYVAITLTTDDRRPMTDDRALVSSIVNRQSAVVAAYGTPIENPTTLPLVYQAETIGQLLVAPRAPGETFTPAERRLLEDIALQAGVAAHAVRLTVDLQRSRERLVTAREEERRRLRRDLHDGLGPQLASLTLTLAAARELLGHDVEAADRLLHELGIHTQAAIADIRRVVYDLRPPALDDLGLVLALREQAANYTRAGLQITIDAPDHLPPLPAAVEVAAYRITQEALMNVVRHAQARTCAVSMTLNGALDVEVRDDGVGLPPGGRAGVGLTSMRERTVELGGTCVIESVPGRGTCIRVQLPLHQEGV